MKDTAPKKLKPKRIALITLKRGIKDFQEDSENVSNVLDELVKESNGGLVIDRPRMEAFRAISRKGERKYKTIFVECYALPPEVHELVSPWKMIGEWVRTPVVVLWPRYFQYQDREPKILLTRTRYFRALYYSNGSVKGDIREFLQERGIIGRRENIEGQIAISGKERRA